MDNLVVNCRTSMKISEEIKNWFFHNFGQIKVNISFYIINHNCDGLEGEIYIL